MVKYKKYFNFEEVSEYIISQYKLLCSGTISAETSKFIRGYVTGYGKALKSESKLTKNTDTGHFQMSYEQVLKLSNDFFTSIKNNAEKHDEKNLEK